jgi:hypothetical protein
MATERRTTRDGVPGKIIKVAPKEGYERFVADRYHHHDKKHR